MAPKMFFRDLWCHAVVFLELKCSLGNQQQSDGPLRSSSNPGK